MEINSLPSTRATAPPAIAPVAHSRFLITPLASPMKRAAVSIKGYLEEGGHLTKVNPSDAWLPITESRGGNAAYAAFHTLSSGIGFGFQAFMLPVAFASLGWTWGLICLVLVFLWQFYTLWLLTQLHEDASGVRYSRYLHLCLVAFGEKLGKILAKFPIMYLSGGTCTALVVVGGGSMKLFYNTVCGSACREHSGPLTAVEWYVVFTCVAVVVAQLPNLNSIAGVSLIGAITALGYCTTTWVLSVVEGPVAESTERVSEEETIARRALDIFTGIGIIAFAFRGHNLTLEIQGTMPSTLKHPSHVPMWRGVRIAYALIALCFLPIAIGGYWAYGNKIAPSGILSALHEYHGEDIPRSVLALTTLMVVINCLSSFQLYAMPVFDTLESVYTSRRSRPCPRQLRGVIRLLFGVLVFFIAVAFPFLPDLAALLGGVALPVTLAYPCFMWALLKRPERLGGSWWLHWGLGAAGMGLSFLLVGTNIWGLIARGLKVQFFRAR